MDSVDRGSLGRLRGIRSAYLVLALSLLPTLVAVHRAHQYLAGTKEARLQWIEGRLKERFYQELRACEDTVRTAASLAPDLETPNPEVWNRYWQAAKTRQTPSSLSDIGMARWVSSSGREAHLNRQRLEHGQDYTVDWGEEEVAAPVVFVDAMAGGARGPVGWNLWLDPVRREAMIRAREERRTVSSEPLMLYNPGGGNQTLGFILFHPVFGGADPGDGESSEPLGFVFASFRAEKLGEELLASQPDVPGLRLRLSDGGNQLFPRRADTAEEEAGQFVIRSMGRAWGVGFSVGPELFSDLPEQLPWGALLAGLLICYAMFRITWIQGKRRMSAEAAGAALKEANDSLQRLMNSSLDMIIFINRRGRIEEINRAACRAFGRTRESALGCSEEILYASKVEARRAHQETLSAGSYEGETIFVRQTGEPFEALLRSSIVRDEADEIVGVMIVARDLTDRKRTEAALRHADAFYAALVESLPQRIFRKDLEGRFTFANERFCEALGVPLSSLLNRTDFDFYPDELARMYRAADAEVLRTGKTFDVVEEHQPAGGQKEYVQVIKTPIMEEGRPIGIQGIFWDVTEKKRMEEELQRASKLESIGLMAGGIAHDFNNILTGILGNVSLAKVMGPEEGEAYPRLVQAEKACLRAKELTQQLLTFSKGGPPRRDVISPAALVDEAVRFALLGSPLACDIRHARDLWRVEGDQAQLAQAIRNVLINAKEAMDGDGTARVTTGNIEIEAGGGPPLPPGRYVFIAVTDTGEGILPNNLARVFDPYFTTKDRASGLGLATAYSIVQRHGGVTTVNSTVGEGACFTVYLPATDKMPSTHESEPSPLPMGAGRILVMDDDPAVLELAEAVLSRLGYTVEVAAEGAEALRKCDEAAERGDAIDVVIVGLTAPGGMGGRETIAKLRASFPNVRALVSSGYSNDPVMANYREHGFDGRVFKPYQMEEMARALSEATCE